MRPQNRAELMAHIEANPVEGSLADKRAAFAARLAAPPIGTPTIIGNMTGLMVGEGDLRAIWLHGGGYVYGSAATHTAPAHVVAQHLNGRVFIPDYPLAPEYPWPAPLEAVRDLLDSLHTPVALFGDSAGGHLAIHCALHCALHCPGRVRALALFSPNTDRSGLSTTRIPNTPVDPMNSDEGDRALFRLAMPTAANDSHAASPLLADLSALPPTYLCASEGEVLLDDTRLLAETLGITANIVPYAEAGLHMFQNWPDALPSAKRVLKAACAVVSA